MEQDADRPVQIADPGATTWHWELADVAGIKMTGPDVAFESQQAAEDWLRDEFDALADDGVATVSLRNGGSAVYGPMFLTPEADGPVAPAQL